MRSTVINRLAILLISLLYLTSTINSAAAWMHRTRRNTATQTANAQSRQHVSEDIYNELQAFDTTLRQLPEGIETDITSGTCFSATQVKWLQKFGVTKIKRTGEMIELMRTDDHYSIGPFGIRGYILPPHRIRVDLNDLNFHPVPNRLLFFVGLGQINSFDVQNNLFIPDTVIVNDTVDVNRIYVERMPDGCLRIRVVNRGYDRYHDLYSDDYVINPDGTLQ